MIENRVREYVKADAAWKYAAKESGGNTFYRELEEFWELHR